MSKSHHDVQMPVQGVDLGALTRWYRQIMELGYQIGLRSRPFVVPKVAGVICVRLR